MKADMLAFYGATYLLLMGVRDFVELPGPDYFQLAWRTMAFPGVMANRIQALQAEKQKKTGFKGQATHQPNVSPDALMVVAPATQIGGERIPAALQINRI